jgi:hypothetical protein
MQKITEEALSSFKNLNTLIPNVPQAINYREVYRQINDKKQVPLKIIDPVKDRTTNWEK